MELIRVEYSRRVTPAQYESVGIGGALEFKPTSEDVQKEFEQNLLVLKLIVDGAIAKETPLSGGSLDNDPSDDEPDLGDPPAWVAQMEGERLSKNGASQEQAQPTQAPPPPAPPPAPDQPVQAAQPAQQGAPPKEPSDKVYLPRAKVFRTAMKTGKTGRVYAELRVGHDDLPFHINDKYVTVRVFDPAYAPVVGTLTKMKNTETGEIEDIEKMAIVKNDFVDIWGKFSPWNNDSSKFDMIADAIQKSQ